MIVKAATFKTWYQDNTLLTIQLLNGYIQEVEKIAEDSFSRFQSVYIEDPITENIAQGAYYGIDSSTFNLDAIVNEYFPNLHRRSALISIISTIEHELFTLCEQYRKEYKVRINVDDIAGKGIDKAVRYLEIVAGIDVKKNDSSWSEIKKAQKIRNNFVHNNGKTKDSKGNEIKDIIKIITENEYLKNEWDEIIIYPGYLTGVLVAFDHYLSLIIN